MGRRVPVPGLAPPPVHGIKRDVPVLRHLRKQTRMHGLLLPRQHLRNLPLPFFRVRFDAAFFQILISLDRGFVQPQFDDRKVRSGRLQEISSAAAAPAAIPPEFSSSNERRKCTNIRSPLCPSKENSADCPPAFCSIAARTPAASSTIARLVRRRAVAATPPSEPASSDAERCNPQWSAGQQVSRRKQFSAPQGGQMT